MGYMTFLDTLDTEMSDSDGKTTVASANSEELVKDKMVLFSTDHCVLYCRPTLVPVGFQSPEMEFIRLVQ